MVRNRTTRFSQRLSFYLQVKGFSWSWPKGIFHSQAVLYGESQLVSACNNFHSSVNFMVSVISLSLCKIHYHKLDNVCPKFHSPPPPLMAFKGYQDICWYCRISEKKNLTCMPRTSSVYQTAPHVPTHQYLFVA
jgi:hypothetical protein